jgi:aminomethyltransferase
MPLCYTSILDEHKAVRSAAGIFDVSHMGDIFARGPAAADFLNSVLTNDLAKLQPGQGQYTLLCNQHGGAIDDLYLYRLQAEEFLLVVNASRIEADVSWLDRQLAAFPRRQSVELKNQSDAWGAVAVQGPKAVDFIDCGFQTGGRAPSALRKNEITPVSLAGQPLWVSRTGYTGEDGFEIVAPADAIEAVWNLMLEAGKPFGLKPAGLGARDTLRTEAAYPLYGHELDEDTTPLEAGLGFFVALGKGDFVGRASLAQQKAAGVTKKLAAFKMTGRCPPPRPGYPIWSVSGGAAPVGRVTSGTQSPSLGIGIGLGFVSPELAPVNTAIAIEIRGLRAAAITVPRPIYRRS